MTEKNAKQHQKKTGSGKWHYPGSTQNSKHKPR